MRQYPAIKGHTEPTMNFPLTRREDGTRVKELLRPGSITVPNNYWHDEKGEKHHVMNRSRRRSLAKDQERRKLINWKGEVRFMKQSPIKNNRKSTPGRVVQCEPIHIGLREVGQIVQRHIISCHKGKQS